MIVANTLTSFFLGGIFVCHPPFGFLHTSDGPTWKVGAVGQSRLDYIAVPAAWLDSVTNSCVSSGC